MQGHPVTNPQDAHHHQWRTLSNVPPQQLLHSTSQPGHGASCLPLSNTVTTATPAPRLYSKSVTLLAPSRPVTFPGTLPRGNSIHSALKLTKPSLEASPTGGLVQGCGLLRRCLPPRPRLHHVTGPVCGVSHLLHHYCTLESGTSRMAQQDLQGRRADASKLFCDCCTHKQK